MRVHHVFGRARAPYWAAVLLLMVLSGFAGASTWVPLDLPPGAHVVWGLEASRTWAYGSFGELDWTPLGLWRAPIDGSEWAPLGFVECDPTSLRSTGALQETLLVTCYSGDTLFYLSPDDGETWVGKPALTEAIWKLGVDSVRPTVIYGLSGPNLIYRSTDAGDCWSA